MPPPTDERPELVELGRVSAVFGIRGWVKVHSWTRPRDGILDYEHWLLGADGRWTSRRLVAGKRHGPGVIASLEGIEDRTAAEALVGAVIAVERRQLAQAAAGEYYWRDLVGMKVVNLESVELGSVSELMETGANDVLVVDGERRRLIPFTGEAVRDVDTEARVIRVDWDEDF